MGPNKAPNKNMDGWLKMAFFEKLQLMAMANRPTIYQARENKVAAIICFCLWL